MIRVNDCAGGARPPDRVWQRQGSAKFRQERGVDVDCARPVAIHPVACEALQQLDELVMYP